MDGIPPPTIASILQTPAAARVALKERRKAAPPVAEEEDEEAVHDATMVERVHDDPRHTGSDPDHFHPPPHDVGSHLDIKA